MFKLYELTEMYQNIWDLVNDEDADLEGLEMALKSIEDNLEGKAENMAKLVKNLEGNITALKDEEQRLARKRISLENQIKNIKQYLEYQLTVMQIDKVKTPLFTIAMQDNPQSVHIMNDDLIPEEFVKYTKSISKKDLLVALKEGMEIEGAEIKQTKSLRIR